MSIFNRKFNPNDDSGSKRYYADEGDAEIEEGGDMASGNVGFGGHGVEDRTDDQGQQNDAPAVRTDQSMKFHQYPEQEAGEIIQRSPCEVHHPRAGGFKSGEQSRLFRAAVGTELKTFTFIGTQRHIFEDSPH